MVTHEDVLMVVTVFGGLGLVANILLGAFVWQAYRNTMSYRQTDPRRSQAMRDHLTTESSLSPMLPKRGQA